MERIDKIIAKKLKISRVGAQKIIENGYVTVDGNIVKSSLKIAENLIENIVINPEYEMFLKSIVTKEKITNIMMDSVKILYEDDYFYIISKPANLITYDENTIEITLLDILKEKNMVLADKNVNREGIVHRLDKDTSGLLIIAKTNDIAHKFEDMFKNREIEKTYKAIVIGNVNKFEGTIILPIKRDEKNRNKMQIADGGKYAKTSYTVDKYFDGFTLLNVRIETGRTHQIRLHLSSINYPILGDKIYFKTRRNLQYQFINRQALHAYSLKFKHPITNKEIYVCAELPKDFKDAIKMLNDLSTKDKKN